MMKTRFVESFLLAAAILAGNLVPASAQEYQTHFPPEEFRARREKIYDLIGDNAVAVIQGAEDPGGFVYPRQTNTFYYLCGVENSYSYLILDGRSRETTLYLAPVNTKGWENVLSTEDTAMVKSLTGVDRVLPSGSMRIPTARTLYTPYSPAEGQAQNRAELVARNRFISEDRWDGRMSKENNFISLLRARNPRAEIKDLTPVIDEMRSIKSPLEIELMRKAGKLAALAINEAIRSSEAGVYEYQLDAAARYIYLVNGARLEGYRSITASGVKHILDGHYYYNSGVLSDGDLVLMDFAPDYGYYTSDIGRMWPVNGRFNDWQRELCTYILEYHKAIIARIRPGVTPKQVMDEVANVMEPLFVKYGFSKPEYELAVKNMVKTGGGVFSHPVGMAVHDDGSYYNGPLKPGQVFAVDPQIRVPSEGLYMRVEDTVLVTGNGVEVLTSAAPIELDLIEKMVREKGMVQLIGTGR